MGFLLSWFLFSSGFSDLTVDLLSWLSTLLVYLSSIFCTLLVYLSSVFSTLLVSIFSWFFILFWFLFSPKLSFLLVSSLFCCFQMSFSPTNFVSPMLSCSFCQSVPFVDSNSLLISELGIWRGSFYCFSENRVH